jgi:putative SOS response-associated peptidase YedK
MQPVIRASGDTGERELVQLRWDLVPFFTKQLSDARVLVILHHTDFEPLALARAGCGIIFLILT